MSLYRSITIYIDNWQCKDKRETTSEASEAAKIEHEKLNENGRTLKPFRRNGRFGVKDPKKQKYELTRQLKERWEMDSSRNDFRWSKTQKNMTLSREVVVEE